MKTQIERQKMMHLITDDEVKKMRDEERSENCSVVGVRVPESASEEIEVSESLGGNAEIVGARTDRPMRFF